MDKSLRVLQVLRAPVGGLFRHVCDLATQLDENGHQVGIVVDALSYDSETELKLAQISPRLKLGIHPIAIPRLFGPQDLLAPFKISKLFAQHQIDVVHGHGAKGGFHARLAGWNKPKVKKIYTPHGGALHFSQTSMAGRIFHFLEKRLIPLSDHIIFESSYAQNTYKAQIGDVGEIGSVIHNGLSSTEFTPIPSSDAYDFVFVGEMRDLKGVEYLLHALKGVKTAQGVQAKLLLIGDGPHRAQFEQLAGELGLNDSAKFVGPQPAKNGFASADIVIVPSLKESLPYIVMEAVAAGKHVIATDVGGIGEIYGPEKAQLIPAADVDALRGKMIQSLANSSQQQKHRNALFDHVRSNFVIDKMAGEITAKYFER
ncbi:glycosyltransferase [Maritalea sp.]|uniref:glycosyltransferase n=1 Tax=Maritalea sp. TaxID=2003361 RepID=UPI003EF71CED